MDKIEKLISCSFFNEYKTRYIVSLPVAEIDGSSHTQDCVLKTWPAARKLLSEEPDATCKMLKKGKTYIRKDNSWVLQPRPF